MSDFIWQAVYSILADNDAGALMDWGKLPEEEAVTMAHHGIGRHLRNKEGMWDPKSPASKAFHEIGITHPDDMSGILLTCAHRIINRKPCNLREQVAYYQRWWNAIENGGTIKLANGSTITFTKDGGGIHRGNDQKQT